ncbi:MAG: Na+/H+ antiporter NhaC family protein [Muribaculaceae bacterium]
MMKNNTEILNKIGTIRGLLALSPVIIFLLFYLVVSIVIGDFYKMPISIAFIVASMWAIITTYKDSIAKRIEIFSKGAANENILYMIWIFILAGAFAALAKGIGSIDATVSLTLNILPAEFLIPGIFLASCFISISIGTSVGTVVALTPFAVQLAETTGGSVAFFVAVVLGGSFFGDNLSFISDTTIASTRTQGCKMNDKFKANIWIALPAAIILLIIYLFIGQGETLSFPVAETNYWLIIPYLLVIVMAMIGINVIIVLSIGILSSLFIASFTGVQFLDMCGFMGNGVDGMGNLIIITLLAAGMLALIKHNGGIEFIIQWLTRRINGERGAMTSIALLVSIVNVCTANNTIAIITVGGLAKNISKRYGLDPRKVASILDTCSCVVQCLIPYGAQTLLATGLAGISPVAPLQYLYYPMILAIMVILSIIFRFPASHHIKQ